ncbi:MAG: hypothetical protein KA479_08515 [Saprospiraceae bacterium]|jgi:hypothetical protein|nr:hypothetical protein [Saprospiraceae bacterium]
MRHPLRWIAFGSYVVSLFLIAFQGSDFKGYHFVLFGVIGLLDFRASYGLPWFANLLFILVFILRSGIVRTVIVMVTLVLASAGFFIDTLPQTNSDELVAVSPGTGFYVWLFAIVLLAVDALLGSHGSISRKKKNQTKGL